MKRFLLGFLAVVILNFVAAVGVQATLFELKEDGSGLIPDNIWHDGEVYTLTGGGITLTAGQYDLKYSLSGKVWDNTPGAYGWEKEDKIIIQAFLNDTLIGSKVGNGIKGQNRFFEFSLDLDLDLENDSLLEINAYSAVSHISEVWQVDMSNSSILSGSFTNYGGENNEIIPTPEPATLLLLGAGLVSLAGFGRKKCFKK